MADKITALEGLVKARALIADEKNWTTGTLAVDASNITVDPHDKKAVCFCAVGALRRTFGPRCMTEGEYDKALYALRESAEKLVGKPSPTGVNDCYGHAGVLAMYDGAISAQSE